MIDHCEHFQFGPPTENGLTWAGGEKVVLGGSGLWLDSGWSREPLLRPKGHWLEVDEGGGKVSLGGELPDVGG